MTLVDWIFSKIPVRFPDLRIVLSEAGASWVPMARERLERADRQRAAGGNWTDADPHPVDILQRNFWFTSIDDPRVPSSRCHRKRPDHGRDRLSPQ
jgi:predicted TIM-barrel fold metal-dependent hydrolase